MVVGTTKHDKKQLSNDGSNVWDSPKKKSWSSIHQGDGGNPW
jgi:hypothetical protein